MSHDADHDACSPSRPLLALVIATVLALLVGPIVSPAAAHAGAYQLTLQANEDCSGERTYCFDVVEGSLDEIETGEEVQVTLVNPSDNSLSHNVHITQLADASDDRETDSSAAEMNTDNVSPGEEASVEYFVSQGTQGLYLWCDVGAHESQGMYLEVPLEEAANDGGEETNDSPAFGAVAGLLAIAGAALALRGPEI